MYIYFKTYLEGGRLNDELKFLENLQQRYKTDRKPDIYESKHFILEESEDPRFTQIPEDESPTLSYQVISHFISISTFEFRF
jgi:hypothetical protein